MIWEVFLAMIWKLKGYVGYEMLWLGWSPSVNAVLGEEFPQWLREVYDV